MSLRLRINNPHNEFENINNKLIPMLTPVEILHREHMVLLEAVNTTRDVQKIQDNKQYRWLLHDLILLFRNYTEIYHHPKEEQILYPVIINRAEKTNDRFMYELCDNHDDFKAMMADIENYFDSRDYRMLRKTVDTYLNELTEHIEKEEREIIYISDKLLTLAEIEKINEEFKNLDDKLGENEKEKLEAIIQNINSQLKKINEIKIG